MLYHKDVDGDREYVHISMRINWRYVLKHSPIRRTRYTIYLPKTALSKNSGMCKSRSGKQAYHSGDTPGGCAQKSTGFAAFQAWAWRECSEHICEHIRQQIPTYFTACAWCSVFQQNGTVSKFIQSSGYRIISYIESIISKDDVCRIHVSL